MDTSKKHHVTSIVYFSFNFKTRAVFPWHCFKIEEDLNSSDSGSEDDVNVTSDEDEPYQVLNTSQYRKQNQSSWLNRGNVVQ